MMKVTRKQILLSSVSAVALTAFNVAPALATDRNPVTFNTGDDSLSNNSPANTSYSSGSVTTNASGDVYGAYITGNGTGTYVWNINGDLTAYGMCTDNNGFRDDTSAGSTTINFNGHNVESGEDYAGINISTSGTATTVLNLENSTYVHGGSSNGSGIYVNSSSSNGVGINIKSGATVVNGSGSAGINIREAASSSYIDNAGSVAGGSYGSGIQLGYNSHLATLTNESTGLITGGTYYGDGIDVESYSSGSAGLNLINNKGVITGGTCEGYGIDVYSDGHIGTIHNYDGATISGGGSESYSHGINVTGFGTIDLITNDSGATIKGGTGTGYGIQVGGEGGTITEIDNTGTIIGGDSNGHGIRVRDSGYIGTVNNYEGGVISASNSGWGYGILVESDVTGGHANIGTIYNAGSIYGGYGEGDAAIGLFGGDSTIAGQVVTTLLTNTDTGVIQGRSSSGSGGRGIDIGNYHTLTTLDNYGSIAGHTSSGIGIYISDNAVITNLNNGSSEDHADAIIAGNNSDTRYSGGTGIAIDSNGSIGTLTNWGTIAPNIGDINHESNTDYASYGTGIAISGNGSITSIVNHGWIVGGECGGTGIALSGTSSIGTIDNYGLIAAGESYGTGIDVTGTAHIGTINNYAGGYIEGNYAGIHLGSGGSGTIINTAGTIEGGIIMGSLGGEGTGDTVNIYGGEIDGNIAGVSHDGNNYGTVNFNLVGGTFGIDGVSGDGTFYTRGDIGGEGGILHAVNINSGVVTLNNNIWADTTTIATNATLLVNNNGISISHDLVNNGTLDLQDNTLYVGHDISGTGTLALQVDATSDGSHGNIINSAHTVNMTSMEVAPYFNQGAVVAGETLVIVNNPGDLTFDPTKVLSSNGIKWTLSEAGADGTDYQGYSYGEGALLATAASITSGVSGTNGTSVNALSNYTGSDPNILALKNGLDNFTDNSKAGAQLRPDANGGGVEGAFGATGQAEDIISTHLDNFHGGNGVSSGEIPAGTGFWMQGMGSFADQGTISGVDGFKSSSYGATFGGDKAVRSNLRLGAAFTYANTSVDDKGDREGSGENIDSYIGNIYGTYNAGPWYIDGMLTYGDHDYTSTRVINFAGPFTAQGSFNGQQYGAKAEVGYPIAMHSVTLTPLAAFAYDNLHENGYTESGAGGADLIVNGSDSDSYRSTLGAKASTTYTLGDGWHLKPVVHLAWKHEFNNSVVADQDVSFTGGGVSFTTPGLKLPQNAADFGIGADLVSARNVTLTAKYDGEVRTNYMDNAAILKARIDF